MAKSKDQSLGLPDNVVSLLAAADKRNGLPPGTMQAVMQQEVGGQLNKFLSDPTAYHYAPNAEGKRIAGHTGKVSTAFGPFGILESTAAKPGYGVAPLKDKSLEEQVRFASDYLAARSKSAGGLEAGLAGYGEGGKYAKQVASRLGKGAPVQGGSGKGAAPSEAPAGYAVAQGTPAPFMFPDAPTTFALPEVSEWDAFKQATESPEAFTSLSAYGGQAPAANPYAALLQSLLAQSNNGPTFGAFNGMEGFS